jgi:hypothetical protein
LDFLGVSILDIIFTCVSFSFVRKVRHTAGTAIQQTLQRRKKTFTPETLVDNLSSYTLQIVVQDDYQPMHVDKQMEKDAVLKVVWLGSAEQAELSR